MDHAILSAQAFLDKYSLYIDALKHGRVPEEARRYFSSAMTQDLSIFYAIAAGNEKFLMKPTQPVVQLQAHSFFYSQRDGKFHSMVLSGDSVTWGLQFSYPQFYQDPKTREIMKTKDFPNTALFTQLMKWMRSHTLPTPFEVDRTRVNAPIRIGKKSLAWIKSHPQLKQLGIKIT
ncbi:MAG: hypothetical protein HYX67_08730 [Candidatus Melainabacteria bacterium]|nr:hypothetical protein [Candidatus Melainabacteria bacterium]